MPRTDLVIVVWHRDLTMRAAATYGLLNFAEDVYGSDAVPTFAPKLIALVAAIGLEGCSGGLLEPKGPIGTGERLILLDATLIMLTVVLPALVATAVFAWWFRAGNSSAKRLPNWSYSGRIELVTWFIPALIVMFLGGLTWISSHELDPRRPITGKSGPLEVQVVSLDWKWLFIYPTEGVATVNQLVIPVGVPIHFQLTSASVMNSFFIPQLGSQIYMMAGMATQLNLLADQAGTFTGLSAQFSGERFSDMHFEAKAIASDDFAQWLTRARTSHESLDAARYARLVTPSSNDAVSVYSNAVPGLFEAIVQHPGTVPPLALRSQ